ncbi:hypothetical protein [Microcoleus sp.]|uniref:hypothetical protein n=1 Tax=Microcoleus sp. TaxID=44472 RepID=UPI0035946F02
MLSFRTGIFFDAFKVNFKKDGGVEERSRSLLLRCVNLKKDRGAIASLLPGF